MTDQDAFAEAARSRLEGLFPKLRATAERAVDRGLVDLKTFGLEREALASGLESVGNPVGLEAIVRLTGRPPMRIVNNRIVLDNLANNAMHEAGDLADLTAEKITAVEPSLESIGRIEFVNHHQRWGGTGWVLDRRPGNRTWVVTNRHVAKKVGQRMQDGAVYLRSPQGPLYRAEFDTAEEMGLPGGKAFVHRLERIVFIADDTEADCALFELTAQDFNLAPLVLAQARAKPHDLVGVIGYPAYDSRSKDADALRRYFGDLYDVKRFAPGRILQSAPGDLLTYDCTTLGGNSGSPVLELEHRTVVGLHFSGDHLIANSAVSVETLKQLQTGRLFAVGTVAVAEQTEAPADQQHEAAFFAGRVGHDRTFLGHGLTVPPPEMSEALRATLARPSDATSENPHEIRYTHFSVYFSAARRMPLVTVVNIDGEASRQIKRVPPDDWFYDLRIDRTLQLGQGYYKGDYDRGHMVRREDPNFGPEAQQANGDTFHYTNCAPQHMTLNRGKALWQGLENYILSSARTEGFRAVVFTGPVLRDDDPLLGRDGIRVPLEFWKIVAMPKAGGGLHATGYLLSQGDLIRQMLENGRAVRGRNEAVSEGFEIGAYRTFQVAIRHIEQATGLVWPALAAADPMARNIDEAVSAVTYAPVESLSDLVL